MSSGHSLATALDDLRSLDALAVRDTPLARRDPRAKLVTTALFIVTVVSFDRYNVAALLPLALYPTVLAVQAELPWRTLWRALWLASPLVLMIGLVNPLLDRAPLLVLAGAEISAGWISLAAIMLRFGLTLGALLATVAGTGMRPLCAALGRFGVPRVFTVQLLFLHRYLLVLATEAARLDTARALRAGDRRRMTLAVYASLLGHLLLRAFARAQRIHQAMLARGFDGELRLIDPWRWQPADTLFLCGWCGFFVAARVLDLPATIGLLLSGAAP